MDAPGTLARLARREVDAEHRALAALDRQRRAVLDRIAELGRDQARESEAADQLPGGAMLLLRFLGARRECESALRAELDALEKRRLAQLERLAAKRLEAQRFERLAERRQVAAQRLVARREAKALDDLVSARTSRRETP